MRQHSITVSFITAICLFKACHCKFKDFLSRVTSIVFAVLPLGSFHQCCTSRNDLVWNLYFPRRSESGFRQVTSTL
jgi:hypothetical protein